MQKITVMTLAYEQGKATIVVETDNAYEEWDDYLKQVHSNCSARFIHSGNVHCLNYEHDGELIYYIDPTNDVETHLPLFKTLVVEHLKSEIERRYDEIADFEQDIKDIEDF